MELVHQVLSHPAIVWVLVVALFVWGAVSAVLGVGRAGRHGIRYLRAETRTEDVRCVATRSEDVGDESVRVRYYATFERADGSRVELRISEKDTAFMAVGDTGEITWRDVYLSEWVRDRETLRRLSR